MGRFPKAVSRMSVAGAVAIIAGSMMIVGVAVQALTAPAFADTSPFELYCTNSVIGNLAINDVVVNRQHLACFTVAGTAVRPGRFSGPGDGTVRPGAGRGRSWECVGIRGQPRSPSVRVEQRPRPFRQVRSPMKRRFPTLSRLQA